MNAILIHFIGYVLLDALIPDWVGEVESGFACIWYASFATIDVIALTATSSRWLNMILAISCAWSCTLAMEVILLQDMLQSYDAYAQWFFDVLLGLCAVGLGVLWLNSRKSNRNGVTV